MKILFKSFLASLLMIMITGGITAQGLPVYDNTNFISLAKQLVESAKQTAELLKMVEHLQNAREKLEKVNNAVRQYRAVRDITRNNEQLLRMTREDLRQILASPYIRAEEVEAVSDAFNVIVESSLSNLEFMGQVLTSDFLNMDDAQRLEILEKQRETSDQMLADLQLKKKRYDLVISFRKMQELIGQRETNY
jgi:hypothetical protein